MCSDLTELGDDELLAQLDEHRALLGVDRERLRLRNGPRSHQPDHAFQAESIARLRDLARRDLTGYAGRALVVGRTSAGPFPVLLVAVDLHDARPGPVGRCVSLTAWKSDSKVLSLDVPFRSVTLYLGMSGIAIAGGAAGDNRLTSRNLSQDRSGTEITQICVISVRPAIFDTVPSDTQLIFADHSAASTHANTDSRRWRDGSGIPVRLRSAADNDRRTGEALLASRTPSPGRSSCSRAIGCGANPQWPASGWTGCLDPASQQPQNFDSARPDAVRIAVAGSCSAFVLTSDVAKPVETAAQGRRVPLSLSSPERDSPGPAVDSHRCAGRRLPRRVSKDFGQRPRSLHNDTSLPA